MTFFVRFDVCYKNLTQPQNVWPCHTNSLQVYRVFQANLFNICLKNLTRGYHTVKLYTMLLQQCLLQQVQQRLEKRHAGRVSSIVTLSSHVQPSVAEPLSSSPKNGLSTLLPQDKDTQWRQYARVATIQCCALPYVKSKLKYLWRYYDELQWPPSLNGHAVYVLHLNWYQVLYMSTSQCTVSMQKGLILILALSGHVMLIMQILACFFSALWKMLGNE